MATQCELCIGSRSPANDPHDRRYAAGGGVIGGGGNLKTILSDGSWSSVDSARANSDDIKFMDVSMTQRT